MAIETLYFLDEVGVSQLAEAILSKSNARISERIVQEVNDASDHDHVPSALLLNALLKARDQQISSNKTAIDANKTSVDAIKENITTLSNNVTANTAGITSATEEITKLSGKVDALTHLTIDVVIGAITDVQNPSTEILYIQKDDENATICSLWIYRGDSVWIRIGDTTIDLSGYWKKTDTDSIKGLIEVPDVTPVGDKTIQDVVEQAFADADPFRVWDFIITEENRREVGYTGAVNENLVIPATFTGTDGKLYKVVELDWGAFKTSPNLMSVTIPNTIKYIPDDAFNRCIKLETVILPDGITTIDARAFMDCNLLKNINIPNTVTTIGNSVFRNCTSLNSVIVPDTVTTIGENAFNNTGIENIDIPNSVTNIGERAFMVNQELVINVDNYVDSISGAPWSSFDNVTVNWLRTAPTDFVVTSSNRNMIGFKDIDNEELIIPETFTGEDGVFYKVVGIGDVAFIQCTKLASITIPKTVTSIGSSTFAYCTNLTSVTIPGGVTSIGEYAFNSCSKLASVTILEGVTSIGGGAFASCSSLTSITIPKTVTSMGETVFNRCTSLEKITLPEGLNIINGYMFMYCDLLTTVIIPNTVTAINIRAFCNCLALSTIDIPSSVKTIANDAFENCPSLSTINIDSAADNISGKPWMAPSTVTVNWLG